ncbi:MAG TPA: hypothetical protein VD886_04285, partial [Herpetosiphonaceae bacterium]|nr:hypothetical protein [Herpetosiphonaceae bacterium]
MAAKKTSDGLARPAISRTRERADNRLAWRAGLLAAFAAAALGVWLLRAPLHAMPLERDEGAYAVIARDWLDGFVPYRDRFDHKPPFVYAAYAPPALAADPVVAIRRWASAWLIATMAAAWWAGARFWRSGAAGLVAAILVGAWGSGIMAQGITFNTEAIMLLPAVLALGASVLAFGETRHPRLALLASGALLALAALGKPVGVLLAPAVLLAPLLAGDTWRRRAADLGLVLAGVALVLGPLVIYFAAKGALDDAVTALWDYNLRYASDSAQQNPQGLIATLWPVWRPFWPLAALAVVGGLAASPKKGRWRPVTVALLWSAGLIGGAVASLRPYPHYYLAAVPALAVWAGGIGALPFTRWRAANAGLAVAAALALCLPPAATLRPFRAEAPAAQIARLYGVDGRAFFANAPKVSQWITANVGPDASVWVWAAEPQIYLIGGFAVPARFPYDYPLALLPGARAETLAALASAPPEVIVTYGDVFPEGLGGLTLAHGYEVRARFD